MTDRTDTILQFMRYVAVGVINTAVTLGVIALCKSVLGWNPYLANVLGYVAGVTNSFIWNKTWVFRSNGRLTSEALRFLAGFGLCYLLQLAFVWWATNHTPLSDTLLTLGGYTISGYGIATLVGNIVYTLCNFLFNRLVAFRR